MTQTRMVRIVCLIALCLLLPLAVCGAQEKVFKGRITDRTNRQFRLTGFSISGVTLFHFRLQDTEFRLDFERLRSVALVPGIESPFKGYALADIVLADGAVSRAWLDIENYMAEGIDEQLGVRLAFKLTELVRLDLTTQIIPPAPSPPPGTPL